MSSGISGSFPWPDGSTTTRRLRFARQRVAALRVALVGHRAAAHKANRAAQTTALRKFCWSLHV